MDPGHPVLARFKKLQSLGSQNHLKSSLAMSTAAGDVDPSLYPECRLEPRKIDFGEDPLSPIMKVSTESPHIDLLFRLYNSQALLPQTTGLQISASTGEVFDHHVMIEKNVETHLVANEQLQFEFYNNPVGSFRSIWKSVLAAKDAAGLCIATATNNDHVSTTRILFAVVPEGDQMSHEVANPELSETKWVTKSLKTRGTVAYSNLVVMTRLPFRKPDLYKHYKRLCEMNEPVPSQMFHPDLYAIVEKLPTHYTPIALRDALKTALASGLQTGGVMLKTPPTSSILLPMCMVIGNMFDFDYDPFGLVQAMILNPFDYFLPPEIIVKAVIAGGGMLWMRFQSANYVCIYVLAITDREHPLKLFIAGFGELPPVYEAEMIVIPALIWFAVTTAHLPKAIVFLI